MTQDKTPEWAKTEGHRIAMELVPSMALTFDHSHGLKDYDERKAAELPFRQIAQHEVGPAIALALSQAYERGQRDMQERAAVATETRSPDDDSLDYQVRLLAAKSIRSLPIDSAALSGSDKQ